MEAFRKAFPGHPDVEALYVDNSSLSTDGIEWPAYTAKTKATLIFDTNTEVRNDFDTEFRTFLEVPSSMW